MKKIFIITAVALSFAARGQHLPGFSTTSVFQKNCGSFNAELLNNWHNEFLDHVFYGVQELQLCMNSASFYNGVNALSRQFLQDKGIILSEAFLFDNDIETYIREISDIDLCKLKAGALASEIICRLKKLMKDYSDDQLMADEFEERVEELLSKAEAVENQIEKIAVKSALVIAAGSTRYWEAMAIKYNERLSAICKAGAAGRASISGFANRSASPFIYTGFNVGSVKADFNPPGKEIIGRMVVSDAVGAFQGAVFGGLGGGPIGAFAGAILGAGARSVMRGLFYGFTGL